MAQSETFAPPALLAAQVDPPTRVPLIPGLAVGERVPQLQLLGQVPELCLRPRGWDREGREKKCSSLQSDLCDLKSDLCPCSPWVTRESGNTSLEHAQWALGVRAGWAHSPARSPP